MNRILKFACQLGLAVATFGAVAQPFPGKPIRLIVPFSPGGTVDINARAVAPGMTELLGQPVIAENRPGAGGMIGAELVAKAPPDGYTLLVASTSVFAIAPNVYPKPLYHPVRDFAPVTAFSSVPFVLVVHPAVPSKRFGDFVALVKSKPDRMTIGTAGLGSSNHLVAELLLRGAGLHMGVVHYKGSGQALLDLVGGHVDSYMDQLTSSMGYLQSGKLRALAVTTDKRSRLLPDVPTLTELGMNGFDATSVTGLLAPAGTPVHVVERLHAAVVKVLTQPAVKDSFVGLGADIVGNSPSQFANHIKVDFEKWGKVVKEGNIKAE